MPSGGKREGSGRPKKGYASLSVMLPQEARDEIRLVAQDLGISQGEVVAILLQEYKERMDK